MIELLVQLSQDLFQERFAPLLVVKDLVRLDLVLLNRRLRFPLQQLFAGAKISTNAIKFDGSSASWFHERKLSASTMHVHSLVVDLSVMKPLARRVSLLNFDNCTSLTSETIKDFLPFCENVIHISFSKVCNGNSRGSFLTILGKCCRELQSINLSHNAGINPKQLSALAISCKKLADIDLGCGQRWLDFDCISAIAVNCSQLRRLRADGPTSCGNSSIQVLAQHCRELSFLSARFWSGLTDEGIGTLTACTELQSLQLTNNEHITSRGIISLAQSCIKLQEIGIPQCDEQIDNGIEMLRRCCPTLSVLRSRSTHITDASLNYLQTCTHLATLELSHARDVTVPALLQLLGCCVHLQRLELPACQFQILPISVAHSSVSANVCTSLQALGLAHCTFSSDDEFVALAMAAHCKLLRILNIVNTAAVSDAAVCALAKSCPELFTLRATAGNLSDVSVCVLASSCPHLMHLNLTFCTKLTDAGIADVLQQCRKLRELLLGGCKELTSKVLDDILQYGTRLCKVDLSMCDKIPVCATAAFRCAMPQCELTFFQSPKLPGPARR